MEKYISTASKRDVSNDWGTVHFPCPKCGKSTIIRSKQDRANAVKYTCSECGFEGPN